MSSSKAALRSAFNRGSFQDYGSFEIELGTTFGLVSLTSASKAEDHTQAGVIE